MEIVIHVVDIDEVSDCIIYTGWAKKTGLFFESL